MNRTVKAFDAASVHAGNRGLAIDHEAVAQRVEALVGQMTPAQKYHEIRGRQPQPVDGLYEAGGDEELGIAVFRMVDGPRGARAGKATAFPVAIARAATFDVLLERRVGAAIGLEVAAKGGNVVLAPTINLLRHPGWGRAQETYSEDPHHMGAMSVAFVSGAQNHVLASPKHFALNNLENTRFDLSADVGPRALHEVYLPHFKRCVQEAAAASIMSAYNKVNGVYCCDHAQLLTDILRGLWGFRGFVESDWFLGTRSTGPAIRAGLDIEMPAAYRFTDDRLEAELAAGELSPDDVDRAVRHVLQQKLAWNLAELPVPDPAVVECPEHVALAREAAEKSLVLLKNDNAALPLADRSGIRIAVVGDLAGVENLGDRGSSFVSSSVVTTVLAGIEGRAAEATVKAFATDAELAALEEFDVAVVVAGLTYRDEGEFIPTAQQEAEGETLARGGDRAELALPDAQVAFIQRAAGRARRTVVVLEGGSAIVVDDWLDRVDALVMAWYPGREGGHAVANALFGDVNTFGRLPVTVPRSTDQLMPWDVAALHVHHDLLHGYRFLDHHGETPAFPFGFGLSYTAFELSDLRVARAATGFDVTVTVRNTGPREGSAVPQIYVGARESTVFRVPRELRGFARVDLAAGEAVTVVFEIDDEALCYFEEDAGDWRLEPCCYEFSAGQSSRDLPLVARWAFDGVDWRADDASA